MAVEMQPLQTLETANCAEDGASAVKILKNARCCITLFAMLSVFVQTARATPSPVSVTPSSGSGAAQTFSFVYTDPGGASKIVFTQIDISATLVVGAACYIDYSPSANEVFLQNDAGTSWGSPLTLGVAGTLQNSQCSINAGASSFSINGNNLTLNLAVSFTAAYAGAKNTYMEVYDGVDSGWVQEGTWTVPTGSGPPSPVSVTPSSGSGAAQTFSFVYTDPGGASKIVFTQIDISATLVVGGACYIDYSPSANEVFLQNDAGTSWGSPQTVGVAGTLQNSQCSINAGSSSFSINGNNLTLNLAVSFTTAYAGAKNTYMEVYDGVDSGWVQKGTWTVPAGSGPPSPVSVTPSSGSGAAQTFSFVYTDPGGASKIVFTQIDISATLVVGGACYIYYSPPANEIFLENDAGTAWGSAQTVGVAGTLQNSQCSVNAGTSSFSINGNNLTLNLAVSFTTAYAGAKNTYMDVDDGTDSGWLQMGTWTVPGSGSPDFTIAVSPSSQTVSPGNGTSYTVTATSVNGFSSPISLSVSGLPSGATGGFNPSPLTPPPNSQASSTMTITTTSGVQAGTFGLSAQGVSGSLNHSASPSPSLTVSDPATNFTIAVTPGQTMAPGDGTSYAVTVTSLNGVGSSVTLTASGLGSNETATLNPGSVTVPANGSASSILTVTTSTGAQLGTFNLNVQGTSGSSNSSGSTLLTISTASTPALQLGTFIACAASTSPATYCALPTLPAGSYYTLLQSQTIIVGHSNVTITGGSSTRSQTLLVRDPANTSLMMDVNATQSLTQVTIQNLTFCGNSNLNPNQGSVCPTPVPTTCGANIATDTAEAIAKEPQTKGVCTDLFVHNVDTGTYPYSSPNVPFNPSDPSVVYGGPYSLTIANCDFEDSTGDAIILFPNAGLSPPQKVNDVYIHDNLINASSLTGIQYGDDNENDDRKTCDAAPTCAISSTQCWANLASLSEPRNIRIENNTFVGNNTGAMGGAARWLALRKNTFTNNYIQPQAGNFAGGTVEFDACSDTIQIYDNQMTGPSPVEPNVLGGLELRGRNIYVETNDISLYPWVGVGASSAINVTIDHSNYVHDNAKQYVTGGIQIETSFPGSACDETPRDSQNITVGDTGGYNTVTNQSYGVVLDDAGVSSRNTIDGATITTDNVLGSVAVGIAPIVVLNGYSVPPNAATTPIPGSPATPRALPIDVGATVEEKCSSPGASEGVFDFEGSELTGTKNVSLLHVIFTVDGDDQTGVGGPNSPAGTPVCHFEYFPGTKTLYLDGADGNYDWAGGHSLVGAGGINLTNNEPNSPYHTPASCTIHAGPTSSVDTTQPYILDMKLDIQFLAGASKSDQHMYLVVENTAGAYSSGKNWTYWGYWLVPLVP